MRNVGSSEESLASFLYTDLQTSMVDENGEPLDYPSGINFLVWGIGTL